MSESVQWTVLAPLVLMIVFGILQLGLWGHGQIVAGDAAGAGAEEAAPLSSSAGAGEAIARSLAARGGLTDVEVRVASTGASVTVSVIGRVPGLVDVGISRIAAQATRPKERVTQP